MADLEKVEQKIEEIISSEENPILEETTTEQETQPKGEIQSPQVNEIEVLGKKYSSLEELAEDYKRLYDEFQKRNQQQTQTESQVSQEYDENTLKEAKRILKEKLGILFSDDEVVQMLNEKIKAFEDFMYMVYEEMMNQRDQIVIENLSKKYDGSHGEPKFDLEDIKQKVKQNPDLVVWVKVGDEFYPDLEATYKKVYAHYWGSKTPTKPQIVQTERGVSTQEVIQTIPTEPKSREEKLAQIEKFFQTHLSE